jgi:hypothetical protein
MVDRGMFRTYNRKGHRHKENLMLKDSGFPKLVLLILFVTVLVSFDGILNYGLLFAADWLSDTRLTYSKGEGDDPSGRGNLITDNDGNVYVAWQIVRADRRLDDIGLLLWSRRTGLWNPPLGAAPFVAPYCYQRHLLHLIVMGLTPTISHRTPRLL